ncbi:MAG: type III polyketide synthase [Daejeonella sp.]
MSSCISAISTANPNLRIPQNDIYPFMVRAFNLDENNALRLKQIYDHSGISYRYSVIPDFGNSGGESPDFFNCSTDPGLFPGTGQRMEMYRNKASSLAAVAAKRCLEAFSGEFNLQITHLITVSCTGMYAPGIDIDLVEILGLDLHVERTCINFMGCYGALNALKTADYICRVDEHAKVLVVCVELCTLHFQKENTLDNWVANSLFSDGAAAAVVENSSYRTGQSTGLKLDTFYSEFVPSARSEMGWYIGDKGFEMKLTSKVSKLIRKHIPGVTSNLLQKAGLTLSEIDRFAIHPGGRKILEAAEAALGFTSEANRYGYEILREFGNMSSATILFVLQKHLEDLDAREGENILGFAFGPGLTVESMILKRLGHA